MFSYEQTKRILRLLIFLDSDLGLGPFDSSVSDFC